MEKKKWEWLSTVRGIAATMVVIRHIWPYFYAGREENIVFHILDLLITQIIDFGKVGVVVFFLISGYLLPKSLKGKTRMDFIKNRIIRLYPAYWISIFAAVIFVGGVTVKQVLVNMTMLQTFLFVPDVIGVYWTMPIEIVLYAGCIVFYKALVENNIRVINILYTLIGAACIGMAFFRYKLEMKLPVALCMLIFVAFLGHYIRLFNDGDITRRHLLTALSGFVVVLIPTTVLAYNMEMGFGETWYRYTISYSLGILMFIVFNRSGASTRLFAYVGGMSYSLYLMHRVVISAMCDNLMNGDCPIWFLFVVTAIAFAVSVPVNILIENKLTKYLNKKFIKVQRD